MKSSLNQVKKENLTFFSILLFTSKRMNDVMLRLTSSPHWREELRKTCRENKISPSLANYFSPNKL